MQRLHVSLDLSISGIGIGACLHDTWFTMEVEEERIRQAEKTLLGIDYSDHKKILVALGQSETNPWFKQVNTNTTLLCW